MFITTIQLSKFDKQDSSIILQGLNEMYETSKDIFIGGFIQSILLRGSQGDGLLLTFWQSRLDMEKFLESETGKKVAILQQKLFHDSEIIFREYYTTWQAISHNDEFYTAIRK